MPSPHDANCNHPCTRDHRSRREKIEDWLEPNSGKTERERELARSMLAKMPADPPKPPLRSWPGVDYEPPTGEAARPAGRTYTYRESNAGPDDPIWVDDDPIFSSASRHAGNFVTFRDEVLSHFSREEQAAIHDYMRGTISKQELFDRLHKERPRGT